MSDQGNFNWYKFSDPDRKFDKRIIDKHLKKKRIDRKEYEKFLTAMPDEADNLEIVRLVEEENIIEEDNAENESGSDSTPE